MLDKGLYDKPQEEVTAAHPSACRVLPLKRHAIAWHSLGGLYLRTSRLPAGCGEPFWQQFFGIGIVKTPEDFGVQGSGPNIPNCLIGWPRTFEKEAGTRSVSFAASSLRLSIASHRKEVPRSPSRIQTIACLLAGRDIACRPG